MSSFRFFLIALLLPFALAAQPTVFSPAAEFDFGDRRSGDIVEHTFLIENQGNKVLQIHRVRSSCGCTVPDMEKKELTPGDSSEVKVRIDLQGRSGTQRQNITLNTNDPKQPAFTLSITGNAVPTIEVSPRTLNFQQIAAEERPEGSIALRSTTGKPFQIKSIKSNNGRVETRVDAAEDGLSSEIWVTPLRQKGEGHFTDVLIIETSEPDLASVRVLVMWQIRSGVSVTPGVLSLTLSDTPQPTNRFLMVIGAANVKEPLRVTGAEWPGRDLEMIVTDAANFGWRVEIKNFTPMAGMNREEILIHTNAKGFETLRVPVRVLKP